MSILRNVRIGVVLIVALIVTASAAAFDHKPVHVDGMHPDQWGQTITGARSAILNRWGDATDAYCAGIIMNGYESSSSWVHGTVRFWDKLACYASWADGEHSVFVFDQKGRSSGTWVSYRWQNLP